MNRKRKSDNKSVKKFLKNFKICTTFLIRLRPISKENKKQIWRNYYGND